MYYSNTTPRISELSTDEEEEPTLELLDSELLDEYEEFDPKDDDNFELADPVVAEIIEARQQYDREVAKIKCKQKAFMKHPSYKGLTDELKRKVNGLITNLGEDLQGSKGPEHALRMLIHAAGPRTNELLQSFAIEVNAEMYADTIAPRRFQCAEADKYFAAFHMMVGRGPVDLVLGDQRDADWQEFWDVLAPLHPEIPSESYKLKEFEFQWIFLDTFVDMFGPYNDYAPGWITSHAQCRAVLDSTVETLAMTLRALVNVDEGQFVFETTVGRAVVKRVNQVVHCQFMTNVILSVVCLGALSIMTFMWNHDQNMMDALHKDPLNAPPRCYLFVFSILLQLGINLAELFSVGLDLFLYLVAASASRNRFNLQVLLSMVSVGVELMSISYLVCMLTTHIDHPKDIWECLFLPSVIITRWGKCAVSMLYFPRIGIPTTPALFAIFSAPSLSFYLLIMVVIAGCTHTYFGFLVQENDQTFGQYGLWGVYVSLMKMARVVLFADGDLSDLAGRDELAAPDGKGDFEIDDEDDGHWGKTGSWRGHYQGLNLVLMMMLSAGVVLINTYVGVLSNKYNEYADHCLHYFYQWRAQTHLKALRQVIRQKKLWAATARRVFPQVPYYSHEERGQQGLWVVMSPTPEGELAGAYNRMTNLDTTVSELRDDISEIKRSLAAINAKLDMR